MKKKKIDFMIAICSHLSSAQIDSYEVLVSKFHNYYSAVSVT